MAYSQITYESIKIGDFFANMPIKAKFHPKNVTLYFILLHRSVTLYHKLRQIKESNSLKELKSQTFKLFLALEIIFAYFRASRTWSSGSS